MTLTEFLLARIAEDEAVARDWLHHGSRKVEVHGGGAGYLALVTPTRVLAECEAKRRIVERFVVIQPDDDIGVTELHLALMYLTAVYSDRPDYSNSWNRPDGAGT